LEGLGGGFFAIVEADEEEDAIGDLAIPVAMSCANAIAAAWTMLVLAYDVV
jgi:hypothetical protein